MSQKPPVSSWGLLSFIDQIRSIAILSRKFLIFHDILLECRLLRAVEKVKPLISRPVFLREARL